MKEKEQLGFLNILKLLTFFKVRISKEKKYSNSFLQKEIFPKRIIWNMAKIKGPIVYFIEYWFNCTDSAEVY